MVTMPIFTRIMSPEHYGVVSVYNAWYGILSIFATLNLSALSLIHIFIRIMLEQVQQEIVDLRRLEESGLLLWTQMILLRKII